jgi:RNA-directed DNA polymerase
LLLNVALHGLEEAAGVCYATSGIGAGETKPGSPTLIRYADDMVVLCHTRERAEQIKARLAKWLTPRGLSFNEDKTKIVHLAEDGFDFLGFNVRRYHSKLLIKPSKAAIRRLRQRLASETHTLRGSNAAAVTAKLNPIIKGWAAYYRGVVSSKVFHSLDYQMWKLTYKWATWHHNNKPKWWIVDHYFGKRNKFRNDRWVFGDPGSNAYLVKFSWTDIVRHVMVKGAASPDDPALTDYWAKRRRKAKPPLDKIHSAPARQAGRAMSALRGPPAHRRSATTVPARMGTMVATRHPQGNSRGLPHPPRKTRPTGQRSNPPRARLLPTRAVRTLTQETSAVNLLALAACLSRMPR